MRLLTNVHPRPVPSPGAGRWRVQSIFTIEFWVTARRGSQAPLMSKGSIGFARDRDGPSARSVDQANDEGTDQKPVVTRRNGDAGGHRRTWVYKR